MQSTLDHCRKPQWVKAALLGVWPVWSRGPGVQDSSGPFTEKTPSHPGKIKTARGEKCISYLVLDTMSLSEFTALGSVNFNEFSLSHTPFLHEMHWLPVRTLRHQYLKMFWHKYPEIIHGLAPGHLSVMLMPYQLLVLFSPFSWRKRKVTVCYDNKSAFCKNIYILVGVKRAVLCSC